jgi:hypothetical protein
MIEMVDSPRLMTMESVPSTSHLTLNVGLLDSYMTNGKFSCDPVVLLTPTTSHCLLAWSNDAYRRQFGWSFGEVVGNEIFFMHGDAANVIPLAKKFKDVEADLTMLKMENQRFYTMNGSLVSCDITVFPVMEPGRNGATDTLAFLGLQFSRLQLCTFPEILLSPVPKIFEVGLPIDRREYCKGFRDYYGKPSERNCIFGDAHFKQFCHKATLTNMFSLMMATPDSMLICNRYLQRK